MPGKKIHQRIQLRTELSTMPNEKTHPTEAIRPATMHSRGEIILKSHDLLGPFPLSHRENHQIIEGVDYFTMWVEVKAILNGSVKEVAEFFVNQLFLRH